MATTASSEQEGSCLREEPDQQKQTNTSDILLLKPPISANRERRNVSPAFPEPMSPSSSSMSNDTTFEPTIEMMVMDFDDEQTLNEEEALAALESQDPDEEINTLKEESEIPLEEILAKYKALPPITAFIEPRKKAKKSSSRKKHKSRHNNQELPSVSNESENNVNEVISPVPDSGSIKVKSKTEDDKNLSGEDKIEEDYHEPVNMNNPIPKVPKTVDIEINKVDHNLDSEAVKCAVINSEVQKVVRRTHLLDLYPEGTFDNVVGVTDDIASNGNNENLYSVQDEEDEEIEEEDEEDYKKKVMIGPSYQATIPQGLSQYGDILPYENEDKLIWEPSQVTEVEVEEYLLKIRDIKSNQAGEEGTTADSLDDIGSANKENGHKGRNPDNMENNSLLANGEKATSLLGGAHQQIGSSEDTQTVVKDNEQALHLLVQCGYDFKEALRRKRLNALHLPLNDCMSLWSEEECQKFEEGIQKYGKDFLKIRQNQVRTRSHRELVQFYYLWKKSERRDHNFANADTVDHMDIYLNEDNEYGSNPASVTTPVGSPVGGTTSSPNTGRRNSCNSQMKNISIMSTHPVTTNNCNSVIGLDKNCSSSQQKRRTSANNNNSASNDSSNSDNSTSTTSLLTPTTTTATK